MNFIILKNVEGNYIRIAVTAILEYQATHPYKNGVRSKTLQETQLTCWGYDTSVMKQTHTHWVVETPLEIDELLKKANCKIHRHADH